MQIGEVHQTNAASQLRRDLTRHFVAYHNIERIGRLLEEGDPFSVATNKPVDDLLGCVVWFIEGQPGRPREYRLRSAFVVDEVGETGNGEFRNFAGGPGHLFSSGPVLNGLKWFAELFETMAHFSLGLQEIKNTRWISELERLAAQDGFRIGTVGAQRGSNAEFNRASSASARAVFERLYPDPDTRFAICDILAHLIRTAHAAGASAWGITLYRHLARLNAGQVDVVVLYAGGVHLNVDASGLTDDQRRLLSPYAVEDHYRSVPEPHLLVHVPPELATPVYRAVRTAHERFIVNAAARKTTSPWRSSHSPGVLLYLEQVLGAALPYPEYAPAMVRSDQTESTADRHGGGFGESESNRRIEQAAIAFVTASYRDRGWDVTSVEAGRCGYDLLCRQGSDEEHVEVKGVSGEDCAFIMTAGEMNCARSDPRFRIAVVTRAADHPQIFSCHGRDVWEHFEFEPVAYRLRLARTAPESPILSDLNRPVA